MPYSLADLFRRLCFKAYLESICLGVSMCQNMYVYVGVHVQLCDIGSVGGWVCRRMCMGMCVCVHACMPAPWSLKKLSCLVSYIERCGAQIFVSLLIEMGDS